ncbi:MAG: hypothetical protein JJE25_09280 [Bacteroidia bacterium]|nr:hypothetical protein [Bacteroidia bacterium]
MILIRYRTDIILNKLLRKARLAGIQLKIFVAGQGISDAEKGNLITGQAGFASLNLRCSSCAKLQQRSLNSCFHFESNRFHS